MESNDINMAAVLTKAREFTFEKREVSFNLFFYFDYLIHLTADSRSSKKSGLIKNEDCWDLWE